VRDCGHAQQRAKDGKATSSASFAACSRQHNPPPTAVSPANSPCKMIAVLTQALFSVLLCQGIVRFLPTPQQGNDHYTAAQYQGPANVTRDVVPNDSQEFGLSHNLSPTGALQSGHGALECSDQPKLSTVQKTVAAHHRRQCLLEGASVRCLSAQARLAPPTSCRKARPLSCRSLHWCKTVWTEPKSECIASCILQGSPCQDHTRHMRVGTQWS
jgi:hypothetical protein